MSTPESRAAKIAATLRETHPEASDRARQRMARELNRILDTSFSKGTELAEATLLTKGAKRNDLGLRLKKLREMSRLTQEAATRRTDGWHTSKISRIESGAVGVTGADIRQLLRIYGIRDTQLINDLVAHAQTDREQRRGRSKAA